MKAQLKNQEITLMLKPKQGHFAKFKITIQNIFALQLLILAKGLPFLICDSHGAFDMVYQTDHFYGKRENEFKMFFLASRS